MTAALTNLPQNAALGFRLHNERQPTGKRQRYRGFDQIFKRPGPVTTQKRAIYLWNKASPLSVCRVGDCPP